MTVLNCFLTLKFKFLPGFSVEQINNQHSLGSSASRGGFRFHLSRFDGFVSISNERSADLQFTVLQLPVAAPPIALSLPNGPDS